MTELDAWPTALSDDDTVRAAALAITRQLELALADPDARNIVMTRDDALLTLGIVSGVAELIDRGAAQ